jgi:hypothetical protein
MEGGAWVRHRATGQIGRIVEAAHLWGARVLRVWLPVADTVVRVAEDQVKRKTSIIIRTTWTRLYVVEGRIPSVTAVQAFSQLRPPMW